MGEKINHKRRRSERYIPTHLQLSRLTNEEYSALREKYPINRKYQSNNREVYKSPNIDRDVLNAYRAVLFGRGRKDGV